MRTRSTSQEKQLNIHSQGDVTIGGDVAGRDIVHYNYYPSQDLQIGYLPPSVQFELVDHKQELKRAVTAVKAKRATLLWGIGGVGKTNLAAHVAYRAATVFKGGVIWLQAGNADLPGVCDGLARALGDDQLPRLSAAEKVDAARRLLAGRRALLVLDDVRRRKTLQEVTNLCAPTTGLLVTARQNAAAFPLRIELIPLPHPMARLLFCQRADLPLAMADDPNVDAICRTWGGYPLGLVLSAGRVATEKLPLDRLVQHLRRISLPGEAAGYVPPERVQVNELLEDHFQPLTPVEKRVLDGLAAGFGKALTLPLLAAAAGLDELEVETSLGGLVKAALVGVGAGRYTIHDVVREAVIRRLPAGELRRLRLNLAQSLERHLAGRLAFEGRWCVSPPSVWREVEAEFENCLGAIRWSLEAGERRLAWNLFRLVDYPLGSLGYWDEEVAVCQQVIAACGDLDPGQTAWWKALVLGFTHWQRNETQPAEALAEEAGHAFAALDDEPGLADVQLFRANILTYRLMEMPPRSRQRPAGIAEARELFEQAIAVFERRQLTRNLAHALGDYADYWDMLAGRPERALEYCRRSVELYTRFGDEEGLTLAQPSLCDIYINLGRLAEAEAMLPAMRVAVERLGRPEIIPQVDWSEAALRLAQGEAPGTPKRRALKFFRQGLAAATRSRLAYARLNLPYEVRVLQGLERRLRNRLRKLTG